MTKDFLTNILPDSLSGSVFAFEGIRRSLVLMNGPTGCKFYHSAISDSQYIRQMEFDPLKFPELWYFGQPRVPCTYLDKADYVYGSENKLEEALTFAREHVKPDIIAVINTPGAALIGDDIGRIANGIIKEIPVVVMESPGYSLTVWEGYERACEALMSSVFSGSDRDSIKNDKAPGKVYVNILGLCIWQRNWEGDLEELKKDLELCGIELNCALFADCTLSDIKDLKRADLNLVADPVFGKKAAILLKEYFGTDFVECSGIPVGFKAMEELMDEICRRTGKESCFENFMNESRKARARCYAHISRINSLTGLPKGVKYAVHGTASQCLGYCRDLSEYLGMVPDCVSCTGNEGPERDDLEKYLREKGYAGSLGRDILETEADIVLADGGMIAKLKEKGKLFSGIEIGMPTLGYVDVCPKTHLGIRGGLLLTEQVLNGLLY